MKTEIHQARPLKLSEVRQVENFMIGDSPTRDKYLMGCALFVLCSRSRWSDIAYVEYLELDSSKVDGKPFGFMESSTRHQKTGTSASKLHRCGGVGAHLDGDSYKHGAGFVSDSIWTNLQSTSL